MATGNASPKRRWLKVDVEPHVFDHVHDMANRSRMRMLPYLRKLLSEAGSFELSEGTPSFSVPANRKQV